MATEIFLPLLREFDLRIKEIVFTSTCSTWNEAWPNKIVNGLLFIVKRTVEPTFKIIVKPKLEGSQFCQFYCVESFGQIQHFEEVEHNLLLPRQRKGFVVYFDNLEDSTRALNCIRRLLDTAPTQGSHVGITRNERVGQTEGARGEIRGTELPIGETGVASGAATNPSSYISIPMPVVEAEHVGNGVPNANEFDQHLYLQNTRVVMAMMAIFFATIVFTVGLNPPASINTLPLKVTFQITFWIGAISSLAALLLLGIVTPTSIDMQATIFRCAFVAITVSLLCVVVPFSATTVTMKTDPDATTVTTTTDLVVMIAGGVIGLIGIIIFSYFTSSNVRGFIFSVTGLSLTQNADNPYWLTEF